MDKTDLDNHIAHNYSTQSLNSTELSKQKLKEILNKVASGRSVSVVFCGGGNFVKSFSSRK